MKLKHLQEFITPEQAGVDPERISKANYESLMIGLAWHAIEHNLDPKEVCKNFIDTRQRELDNRKS